MTPLSETEKNLGKSKRSGGRGFMAKAVASISALATLAGGMALGAVTAPAAFAANAPTTSYDRTLGNAQFESARESYGLSKEMNYGAILHAWMWSANTIKAHMNEIADAGYTSIQTVPISTIKGPVEGMQFTENWYYVYQPSGTGIGNKVIGTEQEIKEMTAEAHKHGIRVIADAVINHFTADWNAIQGDWKNSSFFHTRQEGGCDKNGTAINYSNRWQVTHCHLLSLWDLNTENQEVANRMKDYLTRAVADGIDGFRYDAAKHIELPNEFDRYSPYYDTILPNGAQYQYGEVLQGDQGLNAPAYPALFEKYSTNGGGNTASHYGKEIRAAMQDKNISSGRLGSLQGTGVRDNQLVTWVESHDTYANTDEYSSQLSAWQIRMGWGIVGSRKGGAPLFFNRPQGSGGSNPRFAEVSSLGDAGDDEWKHPEVVNVNKFRNAMEGNAEYLRNCQGNNNCLMIERYKTDGNPNNDGMTVVNMDGDKSLVGMDTTLDNGEYVDQVYGGKLVVNNKKITSGEVKSGKVHVFYNASNSPRPSLAVTGAKSFKTDTTQVTLTARNVNNARYSTSEGDSGSFTDGQKITIGAKSAVNTQITVTLTGTDADGKQVTASETFTKKDPNATVSYTAYAKKPAAWNKIYAYVYVDNNAPAGSVIQNAAWPGELMTAESGACDGTADQVYEIPEEIIDKAGDDPIRVIFNNGGAGEIPGNKFPGDTATGNPADHVDAAGLLIDGSYVWDGNITSGKWEEASCVAVTVDSVKISPSGTVNLDLANGATTKLTATVAPASAANKPVKWTSSNEKVAVVKNGVVQGLAKGTATITASVGGKTDTVTVNVTGEAPVVHDTTVYYPAAGFGANSTYIHYRVGTGTWTTVPGVKMEAACDGYVKYTIEGTEGGQIEFVFTNGSGQWDNNGNKNYTASGANVVVENGTIGSVAPCVTVVPVSSVSIAGGDVELKEGASKQLSATVSPSNATDRSVSWKSSNTSVATVDASGKVTAVKAGTATITATAGGKSASVTVKVKGEDPVVPVQSVSISGTGVSGGKATIKVGAGLNLTATVSPSNATDRDVTWSTSNAAVATVDANGAVRAVKAGNAAITATAGDKSASILVTVKENGVAVQSVSIVGEGVENNRLTIASNVRRQLSAQLTPANATVGAIYWSSSDTTVATVSGSGYIVPKAPGVAAITVTAGDTHASIVLTVTKAESRFPDVPKSHHFYGDIEWLAEKGITTGNADGTFTPQENTTRAQTVVFLYRLAVSRGDASAANFKPTEADYKRFPDVKQGTFGAKEILWAANIGLTTGRPDGTFGGDVAVTRDQMVMFLNRFAMMEGDEVARSYRPKDTEYAKFSDVKQGTFAAREILWAVSVGIVNGGTGKFNCSDSTAREQMAAFLHRLDTHLNK
ncbi:Bacterial Ig-like domain (group 2) [Bifidobacterium pseudolongum subsp. globosum]|uniref:Ig-like domain-containing protein n=1 Tax=Bifidobacterium pseudolongum TaxID=1694 RepID=UPI000C705DE4|nr:Ig-like domain-containing protein [Bifidobacterium pseudolongum]PKU94640.1 Bacterial Ig-like domain (group 2) [Bifidobacterium pseudolongum subsp. globosum]